MGYLSAWVGDLSRNCLKPVLAYADIPNKLAFAMGLVVCEKKYLARRLLPVAAVVADSVPLRLS